MKEIKIEWCKNFILAKFKKLPAGVTGIAVDAFWKMAEESGLWVRGTYGSPMSVALEELTIVEHVEDDNGNYLFTVFYLK